MNIELLRYVNCYREKFKFEDLKETDHIFIMVESGCFSVKSKNAEFIINPFEGVLFRKNISYHRQIIEPVQLHLFRYRSDIEFFNNDHVTFKDISRIKSTITLLKQVTTDPLHDMSGYQKNLFIDLINQHQIEQLYFTASQTKSDDKIEYILHYIRSHVHEKLSVAELAYFTGLSYVQFLRRFEAYTGSTPIEYINTLKLQKAKDLLAETDFKIREIALLCGFDNEYYFSKFIKKQTGLSPSAFRNQNIYIL